MKINSPGHALAKHVAIGILTLIASAFAHASAPGCKAIFSEYATPAVVDRLKNNGFETGRNFDSYINFFKAQDMPGFQQILQSLPKGAVYLDAGAGQAQALRDILHNQKSYKIREIELLGVSYERPDNPLLANDLVTHKDRFKYIDGAFIEQMMADHQSPLAAYKGKVNLISEVFGPVAYTRDMSTVLSSYADLLKKDGYALLYISELPIHLMVHQKNGNISRMTLRELSPVLIPMLTGGRLRVVNARMRRSDNNDADFLQSVILLKKVRDEARSTVNPLKEIAYEDEAPPIRKYKIDARDLPEALDPAAIRSADILREDSEYFPFNFPAIFNQ